MNKDVLIKKLTGVLKDGIHVVDQNGSTLIYNRKIEIMENRAASTMLGKALGEVEHPNENDEHLIEVLQTGLPQVNQIYKGINRYGNKIIGNVSIWPINERDVITGAIKIVVDVTEVRNLHQRVLGITKDINQLTQTEKAAGLGLGYMISDIVGESSEMEHVKHLAALAAKCDANVMIVGASGTGKEMIAQGIHHESRRKNKPLVAENCAAIPENLLESTLFGTVKGGFTGAVDRLGLFQLANGGTLILDEVNSLPTGLQAKLLRVLQEGTFRPVGSAEVKKVDVRVIAISNKNPDILMEEGTLRSDLFYRLSVIDIFVPPLREREGDLELLTGYFIEKFARRSGKWPMYLSSETKDVFYKYPWNGNVRELSNVIECGVNLADGGSLIQLSHLPHYFLKKINEVEEEFVAMNEMEMERRATGMNLTEYVSEVERRMIRDAISRSNGNISKAAEGLGITRQALQHKLRKMDVQTS